MIQTRALHSQAEAHHCDLAASATAHRTRRRGAAAGRRTSARRDPRGRTTRRFTLPRVGSWLIEFGTKLGGASVRTS